MADFLTLDSLSIVLVFIVPGFVALSIRSQFVAGESLPDNWERSLAYVAISVIYGTLVLRLVDLSFVAKQDWAFLTVVFVGPVVLGLALGINAQEDYFRRILRFLRIFPNHPSPTAWDRKFSRTSEQWVLVTLKNGDTIAGFYGKESFTASSSNERDMYIQWIYNTDEKGSSPSTQEKSVYIGPGEISTIEFWPYPDEEENGGKERD